MRKSIGFLLFIGIVGGLAFYMLKRYASDLVPPSKNIKQYLPLNSETLSPMEIFSDYKMDLFADLKNQKPKVLAFDKNGTLYASITKQAKILAIHDNDHNLKSDNHTVILSGLDNPFGLAFDNNYLYVAESSLISRYAYDYQNFKATSKKILIDFSKNGNDLTGLIYVLTK